MRGRSIGRVNLAVPEQVGPRLAAGGWRLPDRAQRSDVELDRAIGLGRLQILADRPARRPMSTGLRFQVDAPDRDNASRSSMSWLPSAAHYADNTQHTPGFGIEPLSVLAKEDLTEGVDRAQRGSEVVADGSS